MGANGTHTTNGKVLSAHGDPALSRPGDPTSRPMLENLEARRLMSASLHSATTPTLLDFAAGRKTAIDAPSHFPLRAPMRVANRTQVQTPVPAIASVPPGIAAAPAIQSVITAPPAPLATAVPIISLADSVVPPSETPRSPSDFRYVLRPGTGFTGATSQPATAGTPSDQGYDAKAIARWDVVPYQTFDTTFNVGVVAFHMNDIDRVEFSVNGGTWTAVRTMTKNPQTDVYEYTATLRAADFADGALEVRAVAYPKVGIPRVLESLPLNTNANHSLPAAVRYVSPTGNDNNDGLTPQTPKQTTNAAAFSIQQAQGSADGSTIYLLAGTYNLSGAAWYSESHTTNRWMTVTAAPGVQQSQVIVNGTSGSGFNSKLISIQNLTVMGTVNSGGPLVDSVWYDNVHFSGEGVITGSWSTFYVTNSSITNVDVAVSGASLVRNVSVDGIAGDAFSNSTCVVNCRVTNYQQGAGSHANLYQTVSDVQNVVLYGVSSTSANVQLFQYNVEPVDHAIVNCNLDATNWYAIVLGGTMKNVLHKNCTITGGFVVLPGFTSDDIVFDGCSINGKHVGEIGFPTTAGVTFK